MDYQFANLQQQQAQQQAQSNRPSKRRMDDEEPVVTKRYFDLHTQFSPDQPIPQKAIPAITYASPDYRPPPRDEIPLWLQPMNTATSPMTEDESEDESALLTPSYLQSQQQQQSAGKPAVEYWGNMMIDQWQ